MSTWVGRAAFHLRCGPPGGDLPRPAHACGALASAPRLISRPKPFVCHGGPSSWWDVAITGRLNGKHISRSFSTCWTPQMATIGRLGLGWPVLKAHMLARRTEAAVPGTERMIPAGVLRPGDFVTCDIPGHHLEVGVPLTRGAGPTSEGYGGRGIVSFILSAARLRDGSVHASCRTGSS